MKRRTLTSCIFIFMLAAGLMLNGAAFAQDATESESEDTMKMVGENQRPEDFDSQITLPEPAAEEGVENSEFGLDKANDAREPKREFGMQRAQEARQNNIKEDVQNRARDRVQEQQDRLPDKDAVTDKINR